MAASLQQLKCKHAFKPANGPRLQQPCSTRMPCRRLTTTPRASVIQPASAQTNQQCSFERLYSQLALAAPPAVSLLLAAAAPALAEEDAAVDAAFAAAIESQSSTDLLVSVLAALVFGLLVVVTGGVAYLTLKSFFDERQEKEDRNRVPLVTSSPSTSSSPEGTEKKRVRVKREKRGFGGN